MIRTTALYAVVTVGLAVAFTCIAWWTTYEWAMAVAVGLAVAGIAGIVGFTLAIAMLYDERDVT